MLPLDEVRAAARAREGSGRDAVLHGRVVSRAEGFAARADPRDDRGGEGARPRDLRDARACCAPGQAERLAAAGLDYYNHNLDSSEEFYSKIISTRTYADRLETLERVRAAGIKVCCGGILGMGETRADRAALLHTLATLDPQPESVPINELVPIPGTPLQTPRRSTRSSSCARSRSREF